MSEVPGTPNPYGQQLPPPQPDPYAQAPYSTPPYPYAQQPYGGQPYYGPRPTNTMAILALVFAFVFSPLAIVFGHIARKQIRERGEEGEGLALAGLICGYIFTGIQVLFCLFYIGIFATMISTANYS